MKKILPQVPPAIDPLQTPIGEHGMIGSFSQESFKMRHNAKRPAQANAVRSVPENKYYA